jgi:hypothetical protein
MDYEQGDKKAMDDTIHFYMAPDSDLRVRMDAMETYDDMRDITLKYYIGRIQCMSVNDGINESPHAEFSQLQTRATGSTFGWKASSQRLQQNLKDVDRLPAALDTIDLQKLHDDYKYVLQTKPRHRPVKLNRKQFEKKLYKCNDMFRATDAYDLDACKCKLIKPPLF